MKLCILAELNSKYCLNLKPYLGKDDERVVSFGLNVVPTLMDPYFGRGYNVIVDNFFSSAEICQTHVSCRNTATEQKRDTRLWQLGYK